MATPLSDPLNSALHNQLPFENKSDLKIQTEMYYAICSVIT